MAKMRANMEEVVGEDFKGLVSKLSRKTGAAVKWAVRSLEENE